MSTEEKEIINKGLPTVQASSSLVYIILKNILENGLVFNKSKTPTVTFSYEKTRAYHHIIISDNGIGIKGQYNKKIFEMFKRLHDRGQYDQGSGIGLAVVKLLTEKLNGRISFKSELGKGSDFILQLPNNDVSR